MKSAQPLSAPAARTRHGVAPPPVSVEPKLTKLFTTKIVSPRGPSSDPRVLERERLIAALLAASDRLTVTRTTESLVSAGHDIPDTQEAHFQILEHSDEARVRASVAALEVILAREPAKRRPVLEQRLKRIEEFADESATRDAATALRRKL